MRSYSFCSYTMRFMNRSMYINISQKCNMHIPMRSLIWVAHSSVCALFLFVLCWGVFSRFSSQRDYAFWFALVNNLEALTRLGPFHVTFILSASAYFATYFVPFELATTKSTKNVWFIWDWKCDVMITNILAVWLVLKFSSIRWQFHGNIMV